MWYTVSRGPRTVPCPHCCSNTFSNIIFPFKFDYLFNRLSSVAEQMPQVNKAVSSVPSTKARRKTLKFCLNIHVRDSLRCCFPRLPLDSVWSWLAISQRSHTWAGCLSGTAGLLSPRFLWSHPHIRSPILRFLLGFSLDPMVPEEKQNQNTQTKHKKPCIFSVDEKSGLSSH